MIRHLRLTDLPRQLLPGRLDGEDLAYTRAEMARGANPLTPLRLAQWSFSPSKAQCPLASLQEGVLGALAVLRTRRGPRAWEVAHLFAAESATDEVQALLERAVGYVSSRGGERLFIRLPHRSPVQEIARLAGFQPAFTEEVFLLRHSMVPDPEAPSLDMRPPLSADMYGVFQLHSRALPSSVRAAVGLTLDQWQDFREEASGAIREYVWESEGRIRAWLQLDRGGGSLTFGAMLHPDEGGVTPALVSYATHLVQDHRRPIWVAPSYQPGLGPYLEHRGWELQGSYAVLVRPVAIRIEEPALIPAQA